MIQKLAKLGKIVPKDMFPDNPLGLNREYEVEDIVFLEFESGDYGWEFEGLTIEKYSKTYADKYLMKSAKGRKTSEFPTIDVYAVDGFKNEDGKIDLVQSKYGNKITYILAKHSPLFDEIIEEIENNDDVKKEMEHRLLDFSRFALSIKLNGFYIGEYPGFQEVVQQLKDKSGKKDYYLFNKKKYEAHEKLCSITNSIEPTIWGYVSPYKFYAVKTEYAAVPGGFDATQAWKNFPVSPRGAEYLERADKFIQEYLNFRFCGYNYFLLPERILEIGDEQEFLEYLMEFKKFCLARENKSNTQLEEDLLELLEEGNNSANYTLFFYEKNNSEFKILASIEDIFPSYASTIVGAKKESENHEIFRGLTRKKEKYNLKFFFSYIKEFVPEQAAFLEIVRAIFMQKSIDYDYLLQRMVTKFRVDFANNELFTVTVLKAILILKLLSKLELIELTKTNEQTIMENIYEEFFEEHAEFFNSENSATKKAVFLEGVLAQFLLNIQYQDRKATPFRSRLNSLKLKEKHIKRLLPEIIEKLEQYDKNYYRDLEETISHYLLSAKFDLSDNEISFYFTMGMNLAKEFKSTKENESTNGE
ncbi:MAG: TIGR02556 family CRISPR-associated protein [Gracilimonas sp.]|uniref:TIGR02556 family CRISPR-associated protein n=1 Tax=Gracilimonas sp. TaxID=1974203 RepID=UPI003750AD0E|nr:TIGR02556 family CRISPR-associated protein [Gracilimonas sp.]